MADAPELATKLYRGASAEERRSARREQLIRAAITLYGARGYRGATVKAVCEVAGLTERYFYENFHNGEDLLVTSFRAVADHLLVEMRAAGEASGDAVTAKARAIIGAFFTALQSDPASARVFLIEARGISARIDEVLADVLNGVASLVEDAMSIPPGTVDVLGRAALVGSILQISLTWMAEDFSHSVEAAVDAAMMVCAAVQAGHRKGR